MDITCWNCKTVINLDQAAVDTAICQNGRLQTGLLRCGLRQLWQVQSHHPRVLTGITSPDWHPGLSRDPQFTRPRRSHQTCEVVSGLVFDQVVDVYETWTDGKNTWARMVKALGGHGIQRPIN